MKKIASLIIMTLVCALAIAKAMVFIGTGNDKFTNGLSHNDDDYLSYSFNSEVLYNNWNIKLDVEAYTNRGLNSEIHGRLDEISLIGFYQFNIPLNESFLLSLSPIGGIGATGDFYLDKVQNFNHKIVNVDPVDLVYDWSHVFFHPVFGVEGELAFNFEEFLIKLNASYKNTFELVAEKNIKLSTEFMDCLDFSVGYTANENQSDSTTIDSSIDKMNGLNIGLTIDFDPIYATWVMYPSSMYGFGTYGFNITSLFGKPTWRRTDLFYKLGISNFSDMELISTGVSIPYTDILSSTIEINYVSGFPENQEAASVRSQRNYALYTLGLDFRPFEWLISPYASLKAGCGVFEIEHLSIPEVFPPKVVFVTDLRLGVDIMSEGLMIIGNSSLQLELYGGAKVIPSHAELTEYLKNDKYHNYSDWKLKLFNWYFGCGLRIGLDSNGIFPH